MLDEDAAIRHIFRVACGLDSMVLGEPQILGQLKDAFRSAQAAATMGQRLNRLMQHTFAVAKKIRTDTEIGASPVSVASAAVNLAGQFFAGFKKHTALLVGAGVTVELWPNICRVVALAGCLSRIETSTMHTNLQAVLVDSRCRYLRLTVRSPKPTY